MLILGYGNFTSIFNKRHRRYFAAAVSREETGTPRPRLRPARQTGQKAAMPTGKSTLGVRVLRGGGPGGFLSSLRPYETRTKICTIANAGNSLRRGWPSGARAQRVFMSGFHEKENST